MKKIGIFDRRAAYQKEKKANVDQAEASTSGAKAPPTKEDHSKYFVKDAKRTDYVLVYSKKDTENNEYRLNVISTYVNNIKQAGLAVQEETGLVLTDLVCLKITAPNAVLAKYAAEYKMEAAKNNANYKFYTKTAFLKCMDNVTNTPQIDDPVVQRAREPLSGERPTDYTNAEKILLVNRILSRIPYGTKKNEMGFEKPVKRGVFVTAYPLHDSSYRWTDEGPLTDRQLLARYWASISCFYKEQPLSLIDRYYGPEVGFYFAWMGCYTKMLILPAIFGLISFLIGYHYYLEEREYIIREVCQSNQLLCPICPSHQHCKFIPLNSICETMKLAHILENPSTIIFSTLMSFWGVVFITIWRRQQAILRVNWNLHEISVDRSTRPSFIKAATQKTSVTGEPEYAISIVQQIVRFVVAYMGVLFMMCLYCLAIVLVMYYRLNIAYYGRKTLNATFKDSLDLFISISSSFITLAIMMFFDSFKGNLASELTKLENPRTEDAYNRKYTIKLTALAVGNTFFPMMYLAFVKGHLYTHPGDPTQWTFTGLFKSDVCTPSGCLIDLSVQLTAIMISKNLIRLFMEVMFPTVKILLGKFTAGGPPPTTQWEEDYFLVESPKNLLYSEYISMVLQYGFMTFFVVALPIAPCLALLNNIFELRFDARRILKHHRRIVPKAVTGIEEWNVIIHVIAVLGAISNPLLIAFNSNLIPRTIYLSQNYRLHGFINSTLSEFSVQDYPGQIHERRVVETCLYYGMRYPPNNPYKYEHNINYWYQFSVKAIFFIILENTCLLLSLFLGYVIPEIPRKVKIKMENDESTLRSMRM